MSKKLKAAILGFGGIGHCHTKNYMGQKNIELVALCDIDETKLQQTSMDSNMGKGHKIDLTKFEKCRSYEELTSHVTFDVLDICLPCHLHAEYAIRGMRDGYDVMSEKPMARTLADAKRMICVSHDTGRKLMIGQCLRFSPTYNFIKESYVNQSYGKLLRIDMRRNSGLPASEWYHDAAKSGGALLDLHLHDTDFIQYMLGVPEAVRTYGVVRDTGGIDDLMTAYQYDNGVIVNSEGSWCRGCWFSSTIAVFEKATLELIGNEKVKIYRVGKKEPEEVVFKKKEQFMTFNEIDYFAHCINHDKVPEQCTPESTCDSIRIAMAEERSARQKRKIVLT